MRAWPLDSNLGQVKKLLRLLALRCGQAYIASYNHAKWNARLWNVIQYPHEKRREYIVIKSK